ncbi:BatD family protein [Parahaliea maris]|nr:BatD family protein [Parahaliea maris]
MSLLETAMSAAKTAMSSWKTHPARWLGTWLGLICLQPFAAAGEGAQVRTHLQASDPIWAGQRIALFVELLAPGYFASAANFDLPDPQGLLLMPPADHPIVDSVTIDGTRYSVQRHELNAWAMRDGELRIPPVHVRFSYKANPLDKEEMSAAVTTDPVTLQIERPPGTEGMGIVISARNLRVEETWQPEPGTEAVLAGTAFKRSIRLSAADLPGMVFPTFPATEIDGLGVYSKQQVQDRINRGTLTGMRTDNITYLAKRPGQYTIAAARLQWYDLDAQQLKSVEFPARTLDVIANPEQAAAAGSSHSSSRADRGSVAMALGFALLSALAGWQLYRRREQLIAPFRPVHLQPLNPTERAWNRNRRDAAGN